MINIVGRRYWYFGISLLIIIPGLIALALVIASLWLVVAARRMLRRIIEPRPR